MSLAAVRRCLLALLSGKRHGIPKPECACLTAGVVQLRVMDCSSHDHDEVRTGRRVKIR